MAKLSWAFMGMLLMSSCIGTDYLDDPKDPAILTNVDSLSLLIGETYQLEATYYYNMWKAEEADLFWQTNDPQVAEVSESGLVSAKGKGQTNIRIWNPGEDTVAVNVSVVENDGAVAQVRVNGSKSSLAVGEQLQLSAEAFDVNDRPVTFDAVSWVSSNEAFATVSADGLVTAQADGTASITATIDQVASAPYVVMVGVEARVGTFQDANGYKAKGTATLIRDASNELVVALSEDFETSFALGTFLYLANNTSGTVVASQGLEIAEITGNGAQSYNISSIDASVGLDTYTYVVLLCKPASITFGFAEMK